MAKDKKTKPKKFADAKPVAKEDAKVGDVRAVTHGGGGATFWTSRQLGQKPAGGGAVDPKLKALSISLAKGGTVPQGVTGYAPDNSGPGYNVGGSKVTKGGATGTTAPGGYITAAEAKAGARGMIMTGSNLQLLEAARGAAPGTYYTAPTADAGTTTPTSTTSTTTRRGSSSSGEVAGASTDVFKAPTFPNYQENASASFWESVMNPNATLGTINFPGTNAHSTPMFGKGVIPASQGGGAAGGGAGGGGGGSWGPTGGGINTQGTTPTPAGARTAGVPETGGAASGGSAGDRQLTPSELTTAYALLQKLATGLQGLSDAIGEGPLTSTSDGFAGAVQAMDDALTNEYNKALGDLPDYAKMKSDYEDLYKTKMNIIEDRQDQLERRYKEDKASIKEDYTEQEAQMKEKQASETGRLAGGLAASGAYLGFDNVNHSAMLSLEVTHKRELNVLLQQKMAALSEARRAFEDADFKLLGEQVNAIEAYNNQIWDITKTHFNQTLQLAQEARANVKFMQDTETFNRSKAFDNLDTLITAKTMPTDNDIRAYAQKLNLSEDEVRNYVKAKMDTQALQESRDKTADELAILNVLKGIDRGTFVTIGGKRYEGLNTPASSKDSSSRVMTWSDWDEKFNQSEFARDMVGNMTVEQAYAYFGQSYPPQEFIDTMEEAYQMSFDPEVTMTAWQNEQANIFGQPKGVVTREFKPNQIENALFAINSERKASAEAAGTPFVPLEPSDLDNAAEWPYSRINSYAIKGEGMRKNNSPAAALEEALNQAAGR